MNHSVQTSGEGLTRKRSGNTGWKNAATAPTARSVPDRPAPTAGDVVCDDPSVFDTIWSVPASPSTGSLVLDVIEALTPVGPKLVSADQIGDGSGLALSTTVNGVVKQESNTSHLVFNVVDIISDLSQIMTLDPGDVIATGTPGGVGAARTPPEWLKPGDELVTTIEGVGQLSNRCV